MLRTIRVLIAASSLIPCTFGGTKPAAQPQPKPSGCALHIHVTDEDGKDLPKAFVLVHGEHGLNQQFTPDRTGQIRTRLHAGIYNLFVAAMGFVPQAQIVDLRSCKPLELNPMLPIDSEHSDNDGF